MTRINVVHPQELTDKHLLAEYRELPRVFGLIEKWQARGCPDTGVSEYTLGRGHVKFFYDKAMWLAIRYDEIVSEMLKRGFNPQYRSQMHRVKQIGYQGQSSSLWTPRHKDVWSNHQRINQRLIEAAERRELTE